MNLATLPEASETAIWGRVLDAEDEVMSVDAASFILKLGFSDEDYRRMDELAEMARGGALSPSESEELSNYIRVGHLLSMMQSKARKAQKRAQEP